MSQCLRPCMIHGARSKEIRTKHWMQTMRCVWVGPVSFRRCSTSKQGFVKACKSGACIPHWCAAGISERANPECFVIVLSSNPISISGHSINPIKTWLKVITQLACPQGASPGHSGPAPGCLQAAPRLFWGVGEAVIGADRAAHIQHHRGDGDVGVVLLSPSHPFTAPVLLMDEVIVAVLSGHFMFTPKQFQGHTQASPAYLR